MHRSKPIPGITYMAHGIFVMINADCLGLALLFRRGLLTRFATLADEGANVDLLVGLRIVFFGLIVLITGVHGLVKIGEVLVVFFFFFESLFCPWLAFDCMASR